MEVRLDACGLCAAALSAFLPRPAIASQGSRRRTRRRAGRPRGSTRWRMPSGRRPPQGRGPQSSSRSRQLAGSRRWRLRPLLKLPAVRRGPWQQRWEPDPSYVNVQCLHDSMGCCIKQCISYAPCQSTMRKKILCDRAEQVEALQRPMPSSSSHTGLPSTLPAHPSSAGPPSSEQGRKLSSGRLL